MFDLLVKFPRPICTEIQRTQPVMSLFYFFHYYNPFCPPVAAANWSPDGKLILFISDRDGDRDIFSINPETGEETVIYSSVGMDEVKPVWVP